MINNPALHDAATGFQIKLTGSSRFIAAPKNRCMKVKTQNYEDCHINHDPDLDECKARRRRLGDFITITGFIEITNPTKTQQKKIDQIIKRIPRKLLDHVSYWRLPDNKHAVFVLTEPYREDCLHSTDVVSCKLPTNMSPYCGFWSDSPGDKPRTVSFLFTSPLKHSLLEKIKEQLVEASESAPEWNYLEQGEE